MAVRRSEKVEVTVSCAMIGRLLKGIDDYLEQTGALALMIRNLAAERGFPMCDVNVNAADDVPSASIYITVTGTSAEAGDDGQVGRGNRVNGLITPCRPMSLEAAAGKNPVSHVGKIYNVLAKEIAERLVCQRPEIAGAQCLMVSKIGAPLSSPAVVQIRLRTRDGTPIADLNDPVKELVASRIADLPVLVARLTSGAISVF